MLGEGVSLAAKVGALNELFFPVLPEFYSLLHLAAVAPFPKLLSYCLEHEYLYSFDGFGNTPLLYALRHGNSECAHLIVSHFKRHPERFVVSYQDLLEALRQDGVLAVEMLKSLCFEQKEQNAILKSSTQSLLAPLDIVRKLYPSLLKYFLF